MKFSPTFVQPLVWICALVFSHCQSLPPHPEHPTSTPQPPEVSSPLKQIAPPPKPPEAPVQIERLDKQPAFRVAPAVASPPSGDIGFFLYDPKTRKTLVAGQLEKEFLLASTTKVLSGLYALEVLGPQHRFATRLWQTPEGLFLQGGGDPFLQYTHLLTLVQTLPPTLRKGATTFYYDESLYVPQAQIQEGEDTWAGYNPGLSALSVESNQFWVRWRPASKKGQVQEIATLPGFFEHTRFSLSPQAFRAETGLVPEKAPTPPFPPLEEGQLTSEVWLLSPHLTQGGRAKVPLHLPGLATAEIFRKLAQWEGLSLAPPRARKIPAHATLIAEHLSLPLEALLQQTLATSHNLATELLLLAAARQARQEAYKKKKHPGTLPPLCLAEATEELQHWLTQQVLPKNTPKYRASPVGLSLQNGSGLSPKNRMKWQHWIPILKRAKRMQGLLPISGWSGNLRQRYEEPGFSFRVWAKTGSLKYVRSLVGYLYTESGKALMFGLAAMDLEARKKLGTEMDPVPDEQLVPALHWGQQAGAWMEGQLREWIRTY